MGEDGVLSKRKESIRRAVCLEKTDRVPVVVEYAGFAACATGTLMAEFISSPAKATQTMIDAFNLLGGGDAINYGSFSAYGLSYLFGAKVKVPGADLPGNALWQVVETQILDRRDYDTILDLGWKPFFKDYLDRRIFADAVPELLPQNQKPVDVPGLWAQNGIPVLSGGDITLPFELLCGGRSLEKFFMDLVEIPDKVEAVMNEMLPHLSGPVIANALAKGYPSVWIGGWRTAPCMISPAMWNRFVWPYFSHLVNKVIEAGLVPLLHLDSNWDRALETFKRFPKAKLIVALDGDTDIFRAKAILKGHACIMGDVPASLLAFGTPDAVYDYSRNLIEKIGPDGFILQSGCDIPANAGIENVRAMVAAAG